MNIKINIANELKNLLDNSASNLEIANWSNTFFTNNSKNTDKKIDEILLKLSAMSLGNEYGLSRDELFSIYKTLLKEGEQEDLVSTEDFFGDIAIKIDNNYFLCPLCGNSWENLSYFKFQRCPKCKIKLAKPN